jgi:ATP-dependent RNA helicase MSS116
VQAYAAWLGFYNSAKGMSWDKPTLVQQANRFSQVMGLMQPPALMKKTIGMMVGGARARCAALCWA